MASFGTFFTASLSAALLVSNKQAHAAPSPDQYALVNSYSGNSFFNGWSFFDQPDPTHGFVQYVNKQTAMDSKLAGYIHNAATGESTAYLGVDSTTMNPGDPGRASVRISTDQAWSGGGLFVADVRHTAQGACGSWPALWMVGPDWPHQGEIDILEGVNDNDYNSLTLHTGPNCQSSLPRNKFLGNQITNNCDVSSGEDNTGCSIRANTSRAFNAKTRETTSHAANGPAFNAQGGGVYATLWDAAGIKIYMFPHTAVPQDLVAGKPNPAAWTVKPLAHFGGDGCDYTKTFSAQQLVINIAFCGDWAGADEVWAQSPECAAKAPTCREFVAGNPQAFKDTYWQVASVKVYQTAAQQAESGTSPIAAKGNGKRHEFPATLGEVLPEDGDADCMDIEGAVTATASMASPSGNATGYGNATMKSAIARRARK